jgi:DNA-binding LacI/PurR family transcriptional regulator/DNA-binding transcriptional regulator YhcF (GntR family)
MSTETAEFSTVHQLAQRLERDIRIKSLAPGDRYLTASEAARMLGVSRTVADRALLLLAKRDMLVRRRGQGTLVGPVMQADSEAAGQTPRNLLQSVMLLTPSDMVGIGEIRADMLVPFIKQRFDQALVHMLYLPEHDVVDYVAQTVERSRQAGECLGVIAMSCTRPVYGYLAESEMPTVVIGSLYPDQRQSLPSIDFNHFQVGELLVRALASRGHKRLGLMLGGAGRAGTESLLNGVLSGMHDADLSPADLLPRFYPGNQEGFTAQLKSLLSMPDRPSAIIAGSKSVASWIVAIAEEMGLSIPGQLDIGYLSETGDAIANLACPRVQPEQVADGILVQAVDMLWRKTQGIALDEPTVQIPVAIQGIGDASRGTKNGKREE